MKATTSNSPLSFLFVLLLSLALATFSPNLLGQSLPNHEFNPAYPVSPYGLTDLDNFPVGDYAHCKWGVWQDSTQNNMATLKFDSLTLGDTQQDLETDLFLTRSLQTLNFAPFASLASRSWTPSTGTSQGSVSIKQFNAPSGDLTVHLLRKLHFNNFLDGPHFFQFVPRDAKKLIILIHGWNPSADPSGFTSDEFTALADAINSKCTGTDWNLSLYHWEEDADTGGIITINPRQNPTEAAEIAHQHGQHLGELLAKWGQLEKVQLIAHSAGAWSARSAARYLLQKTNIKVEVTLLDPFIPGLLGTNTSLQKTVMDQMPQMDPTNSGQLYLLENYFAVDDLNTGDDYLGSDFEYYATSAVFSWRTKDPNLLVNWGSDSNTFYKSHNGPIQFYADTVLDPNLQSNARLQTPAFQQLSAGIGWKRSMFYREPQIGLQPTSQSVSGGASVTFSSGGKLRGTQASDSSIKYNWGRIVNGTWAKISKSTNSSAENPALTISSVTSDMDGAQYRLEIENDAGYDLSDLVTLHVSGTTPPPSSPSITSVYPSALTGMPIGTTQPLYIFGSGFTNNSTLTFNDGAIDYTNRVPQFESASELVYNITVGLNPANWSVKVMNGSQGSNVQTFQVVAASSSTGSLAVTLQPSEAISAGAQWQVDGGSYRNNGDVVSGLATGQHTISCKPVSGYTAPVSHVVSITSNSVLSDTETYSAVVPIKYTLTLLSNNSSAGYTVLYPQATSNSYPAGTSVQLTANSNFGYHFTGWSGDVSGSSSPVTIIMNGNKSVIANFASGDPNLGTVTVTILPKAAAEAGVTWGLNADDHRASGTSYTAWPVTNIMSLHTVDGWLGALTFVATLTAGQTTNITLTCTPDLTPGLLTVAISPPNAVTDGAKWHLNGGAAQGNGVTVSLPAGTYSVTYDSISGWNAPAAQAVTIQRAQTQTLSANYTPPVGQPAIYGVSPPIGPLAGGTLLTISGANFAQPATVLVGGNAATNVSVSSSTQITCTTPQGVSNTTVPIVVQTANGSATSQNGFAYGVPRGSNLEMSRSVGGTCCGLAVQGSYAYLGEGRDLIVVDVSTPTSPSRVGRVTLPGIVQDIAILNNYAFVADSEGGLQVVNIAAPSAPAISGYYATAYSSSIGIAIYGGRAYVADAGAGSGLQIFDLSNPNSPALLSTTLVGGSAIKVLVKASSAGVFAYLSTGSYFQAVEVSNPQSPILRGGVSIGGSAYSMAINGNYVYAATYNINSDLKVIDISNAGTPSLVAAAPTILNSVTVAVANGYVYAISDIDGFGFYTFSASGSSLSVAGNLQHVLASAYTGKIVISGNYAFIASGYRGFQVVSVSNLYNPSLAATFTDGGAVTSPYYVSITGNTLCSANGDFKVFNISDPTSIDLVGQLAIGGSKVVTGNGIAYVIVNNVIDVVDVTTPSNPRIKATIPSSSVNPFGMALVGTRLYVVGLNASNQARFVAFDVSNSALPTVIGTKDFTDVPSAIATSVAVNGTKAIVGGVSSDLRVLDISNLGAPSQVGRLSIGNYVQAPLRFSSNGEFVYFTSVGSPATLNVVSLADPASPSIVTSLVIDANAYCYFGIDVRGNELYVSTSAGLYCYDISAPASPILIRSYYTISGIVSLCAPSDSILQSNNVYVADSNGGVCAFRANDIQSPNIYITDPIFGSAWTTAAASTELGGGSDDNVGVTSIIWANDRGGSGAISAPFDSWYVSGIPLLPGTNVLTVTAFDTAGNGGSDTITVVYQPAKQSQTITFPAIGNHTYGDPGLHLTAAASSGQPVTFSVISGPATLSSNMLTLTGAGNVTVRANQAGNDSFNPATPVDVSFTVAKADQAIVVEHLSDMSTADTSVAITATTNSGLPVSFEIVSGPAILYNNIVTLLGAGTVTLNARQAGDTNYNAALMVQRSFKVSALPQSIAFSLLNQQMYGDAPFMPGATASSGLPVGYASSNTAVAVVSGSTVIILGAGTTTITASQSGDNVYLPASNVSQVLTVVATDSTAYGAWKVAAFTNPTDRNNPAISGEQATPAHDGITNLMKYALALNPMACGAGGLPTVSRQAGYLTLTYRRDKQATDLTYTVQAADSLNGSNWTPATTVLSQTDEGGYWLVTVEDTVPYAGHPSRFMRLQVTDTTIIDTTPYGVWATSAFTNPADRNNPAISGEQATPAHDGITNLMKYALALDPLTCSTAGLPTISPQGGYLTLTYRKDKLATDVTYTVQATDSLIGNNWSPATTVLSQIDEGSYWLVTVRDTVPSAGHPSRFMRLQVTH